MRLGLILWEFLSILHSLTAGTSDLWPTNMFPKSDDCTRSEPEDNCYFYNDKMLTWHKAKEACEQVGARLLIINDNRSFQMLSRNPIIHDNKAHQWIGLTDLKKEGTFKWIDGKGLGSFQPWLQNQPDNGKYDLYGVKNKNPKSENCAVIHSSLGWMDMACSRILTSFCESTRGVLPWNECQDKNGGCQQKCHFNNNLPRTCSCHEGFKRAGEINCTDIDECQFPDNAKCGKCTNTAGSFECACVDGYDYNEFQECVDVDECSQDNGECANDCVNSDGFFSCACPSGHKLVNKTHCQEQEKATNPDDTGLGLSTTSFVLILVGMVALVLLLLVVIVWLVVNRETPEEEEETPEEETPGEVPSRTRSEISDKSSEQTETTESSV